MFDDLRAQFPAWPSTSPVELLAHAKSALDRRLPEVALCKPHSHTCSVAGGGPSLRDTACLMKGLVFAVNGAHDYLIDRTLKPYACVAMDPSPQIAERITPATGVFYFIASTCHPAVFDKLKDAKVVLWHPGGNLDEFYESRGKLTIPGGSTVGVRAIDLAYTLGFRKFELFGLDSSYHEGQYAWDDRKMPMDDVQLDGYRTSRALIEQVHDFFERLPKWQGAKIKVHGNGLLRHLWQEQRDAKPGSTRLEFAPRPSVPL